MTGVSRNEDPTILLSYCILNRKLLYSLDNQHEKQKIGNKK